ncbi:MAG: hypothetical protein K8S99_08605 [Planctomycetes bacterium]|nr:hypothetical protein [Planctomycetota bacterium]
MTDPDMNPWDDADLTASAAARRASVWVWAVAAGQIVLFGCSGTMYAIMASMPLAELQQLFAGNPQLVQALPQMHPVFWHVAILTLSLGFVPGVVYLIAGFGVRAGKQPTIYVALLLAVTQIIVIGTMTLFNIIAAVSVANLPAATIYVIVFGTIIGTLGMMARNLYLVSGRQVRVQETQTDPWNDPNDP